MRQINVKVTEGTIHIQQNKVIATFTLPDVGGVVNFEIESIKKLTELLQLFNNRANLTTDYLRLLVDESEDMLAIGCAHITDDKFFIQHEPEEQEYEHADTAEE